MGRLVGGRVGRWLVGGWVVDGWGAAKMAAIHAVAQERDPPEAAGAGQRDPHGRRRGRRYAFAILAIRAFAHAMASSTVGRTGRLPFCAE